MTKTQYVFNTVLLILLSLAVSFMYETRVQVTSLNAKVEICNVSLADLYSSIRRIKTPVIKEEITIIDECCKVDPLKVVPIEPPKVQPPKVVPPAPKVAPPKVPTKCPPKCPCKNCKCQNCKCGK